LLVILHEKGFSSLKRAEFLPFRYVNQNPSLINQALGIAYKYVGGK
jgi:hypothetical protein